MDTLEFLRFVITARQGGWLHIAASLPDGTGWRQYWRAWPEDDQSAVDLIQGLLDEGLNVYYSAHLFSEKDSHTEYVIDTRTLFVDLDAAEIALLALRPSLILKSSDNRHQAYWILKDYLPLDELSAISRRLTWSIDKADHSGWYLGHLMRVPNTLNHKYVPPEKVRVESYNKHQYTAEHFESLPATEITQPLAVLPDEAWIQRALQVPAGYANVDMLWDEKKKELEKGADVHFYIESRDRSAALWRLTTSCFRAGFTREETFLIAYHSKNNKFRYLRYGGLRELACDVIRAEREVMVGPTGARSRIDLFRKLDKTPAERKLAVADACRNQMLSHGKFIHARGGTLWYVLEKEGRPVAVTKVSTHLNVLLDHMFGLNPTEAEHGYVVANIMNHTAALSDHGELGQLSYLLADHTELLLHTGSKDVLRITPTDIETVPNGYKDVVFLWTEQPMKPDIISTYDTSDTWYDVLFGPSLAHIASDAMTPEQAMALLRSWFICLLMRNALMARPILAIFGQPGSGKSTLFKRVYALLYGAHKAVVSVSTVQNFEQAMASDPLVVLDNVDTFERWLPDAIARSAGVSEISKRKLYTDTDTITTKLQAFLGINAHNPKFGREDVLDRFLLLTLERIHDDRIDETSMITKVLSSRDKYWGQIAQDCQRVLAESEPTKVAQFRIQDYSKFGQRIANALGYGDTFYTAITTMVDQQKGFVLDEDSVLVNIIASYIQLPKYHNEEWQTPAKLWGLFDLIGGIDKTFSKQYNNSVKLSRKLWAMQDALKQRFDVQWKFDPAQRTKVWRFLEKYADET